jgi:hypothetical protein
MLGAAVILLSAFIRIESRSPHPLLPLRVITDRTRGGAYMAIGIAGVAMFAVFIFLTYYLQRTKGFSPIQTGLAFLPMPAMIVATSTTVNIKLLPKNGPRPHIIFGMVVGAVAMLWLAQIDASSSYMAHIFPGLVVMGLAMGNVFAPAFATATYGVEPRDLGVASAMVNTMQQVGGSIGTALLSSIFASSMSGYMDGKVPSPGLQTVAAVHGYTTAFYVSAAVFALGAILVGTTMRPVRVKEPAVEAAHAVAA